ncbi:hypothetical protein BLSMQ_3031 [Brevibacterium aurantiacum]|uniref:Uncharacterized protein n=1 Tax=Brevibacterium aurantiacum TaxID=273384 RepID=A0A1D7W6Q0_BREAU|nr:hypothetical protein BLSMQ_3031 [Brevibacterium aurantiacum]
MPDVDGPIGVSDSCRQVITHRSHSLREAEPPSRRGPQGSGCAPYWK